MKNFKVVSLTPELTPKAEHVVTAPTPEAAAFKALGLDVVRGSSKSARPIARVYWQDTPEQTNMVRLYTRIGVA